MRAPSRPTVRRGVDAVTTTLQTTYAAWRDDRVMRLGAGLAYYGLFAIVPIVTLAVMLAGIVFDDADVQRYLDERLTELLGSNVDTSSMVSQISDLVHSGGTQIGLGIIGAVSLLVTASVVFLAFQDALNVVFHAPVRWGLQVTLRRRLVAFGVVLLTGSVLIASFAVQAVAGLLETLVPGNIGALDSIANLLGSVASAVLGTLVLALLLRTLPYVRVSWRHALLGAGVTACFLALGAWAFGFYTQHFASQSLGGAAGGIFVALLFIYYEAQILLGGAVLTRVLHERRSARGPDLDPGQEAETEPMIGRAPRVS